jgi:hypothetical protein
MSTCAAARAARHRGIAADKSQRNGAVEKQRELHRQPIGIRHTEPLEEIAKPQPTLLLEGHGYRVRRMRGLAKLGNRVDEGAVAKAAGIKDPLKPIECGQNLIDRRCIGGRVWPHAVRQVGDMALAGASARSRVRSWAVCCSLC